MKASRMLIPEGRTDPAAACAQLAWPVHSSEMAGRVRAHDWAATPLGPVETWPRSLQTAAGLLLDARQPVSIAWGPELTSLYNDGYIAILGTKHPDGLGKPYAELFAEVWDEYGPLAEATLAGEAQHSIDQPAPLAGRGAELPVGWFTFSWTPLRDDAGAVAGFLCAATETTEKVRAEAALRASEERQIFLLGLGDALRPLASPSEVQETATRLLGEHLGASHVHYAEALADEDSVIVCPGYADGVAPFVGLVRISEFGDTVLASYRAGQTIVIPDIAAESRTEAQRRAFDAFSIRAAVGVPLVKGGRLIAALGVHHSTPRDWTPTEIALIEQVAERTWAAVERAHADATLRESEARFRGFAENSADTLWIADRSGERLEYLSPAFERTFSEPRDRVMADLGRWRELVHPDDRAGAMAFMPRATAGEVVIAQYRVVRPADGTVRWLRDTGFPVRDVDGAVARVGGIVQDITDLERATAALRAEKERFRTLVEGIPQLVWRSRDGGLWTWASPQWLDYTSQNQDETHGWGWLNAVHPDDREAARQAWHEAPARGQLDVEYRVRRARDNGWRWHATRSVPMRSDPEPCSPEDRVVEWLGTATDIDDQVRTREVLARSRDELEALVEARTAELMAAEASLRQAQKLEAVGQLTGGIAHDFNNMLQGIMGSLELMRRRVEQGRAAEAARYVESARQTVQRAAALTHRLLAFARQLPLDPAPMSLDRLAVGMEELIRRAVGPAVEVELRLGNGTWRVLCDESQMENALLNLCVNARDAMPGGGWLTISTGEVQLSAADLAGEEGLAPGAYAVISVADTGIGMAPEVMARALEPFFTTKPLGQGTGLGLSQLYGFVRQSGGVVRIESAPGQGTTVRLFLSRHEPAPAEDAQDGDKMTDVVLLVEDEEMLRQTAAEWLREAGHRVLEAPDGAAALRLLHGSSRLDVLVTDVGLPGGMNGRQVADAAHAHRPGLPVLFMTGYAGMELPPSLEVISKPFTLNELADRVWGMLETARSGESREATGRPQTASPLPG